MTWYVIYEDVFDDNGKKEKAVMSIFDTDCDTKEKAIKEAIHNLSFFCPFEGKIIYVTSNEADEKLLDYDLITEADAESVVESS